jgi:hypothetical protein
VNILGKKWKLMQRDLLCIEFDKILYESLNSWQDEKLQESREKLQREIRDKWHVGIYVPEANVKLGQMFEKNPRNPILKGLRKEDFTGTFKWWTISGEPYQIVRDAREGGTTIVIDKDGKVNSYSFKDNNLVYCEPHKIPLIIDPSGLNFKDAEKVKKVVWDIVKKDLGTKKKAENGVASNARKGERWNPPIPGDEPKELAQIFHSREDTFKKYLYWYDLKMEDISFRLIAVIEKNKTQKKKQEAVNYLREEKKKPKIERLRKEKSGKIGNRLIEENGIIKEVRTRGESTVRGGFNIIFRAIHRTNPPTKERDIQTYSHEQIPKHNCPEHGEDCSLYPNCNYRERWLAKFDKIQRDVPLIGKTVDHMELEKHTTSPYAKSKRPPKIDYSETDYD